MTESVMDVEPVTSLYGHREYQSATSKSSSGIMPRNITFQHPGSSVSNTRHCRISTPAHQDASEIDPAFPTIVLLHPIWVDGFFFYPQLEDPSLNRHFNLIAIDSRAHGLTTSTGCEVGYDVCMAADDIHQVLLALNVETAHIVGCSTGALTAVRYASRYDCASLTCIGLPTATESEENAESFRQVQKLLLGSDLDGSPAVYPEDILNAVLSFGIDRRNVEPIRELVEEYRAMYGARSWGQDDHQDAYIYGPLLDRKELTEDEIASISCPVLLIHGAEDNTYSSAATLDFQRRLLMSRSPTEPLTIQVDIVPDSPHWCSLYCPTLINGLLVRFFERVSTGTLLSTPGLYMSSITPPPSPLSARRPSTPRDNTSFRIPPLRKISDPAQLTLGEVEQMYLRGEGEDAVALGKGWERSPSIVHLKVEVIRTDENGTLLES